MGLWGRKEACLSVGTQAEEWKEILGIYLPVFEKGTMSVEEQHRGVMGG